MQDADCELILVDNASTDETAAIATRLGVRVEQYGPERSAQRNRGAAISTGDFLCFIDADMLCPPKMVAECLELMEDPRLGAVVIPEESFGEGFWSRCKVLERSCYPPGSYIEAARFYRRAVFEELGGFDEDLTGLEDLDLHQRCAERFRIAHSTTPIRHDEGRIGFGDQMRKKFYYGRQSSAYAQRHPAMLRRQANPFRGYFLRNWRRLLKTPLLSLAMIFMKICELASGGAGIAYGLLRQRWWVWPGRLWRLLAPPITLRRNLDGMTLYLSLRDNLNYIRSCEPARREAEKLLEECGDSFWDVGANVGIHSLLAARAGKSVVAFEMSDKAARLIERSAAANGLEIKVENRAFGAESFHYRPVTSAHTENRVRLCSDQEKGRECITYIEAERKYGTPELIKMDIEGGELDFLKSEEFKRWIVENRITLAVEIHSTEIMRHVWRDVSCRKMDSYHVIFKPDSC
jgi:FkbM family methyltransferase